MRLERRFPSERSRRDVIAETSTAAVKARNPGITQEPARALRTRGKKAAGLPGRRRLNRPAQLVVGYSGAPDSEHALEWAARIAEPIDAKIHVIQAVSLRAVPVLWNSDAIARMIRSRVAQSQASAELAASRLRARGLHVTTGAQAWFSADTIIQSASELKADLIVIGQRRGRRLARLIEGSISSQVVRLAHPDVIVAIGPPPKVPVLRVLVGIDGSLNSVRALRAARRTFPSAEISALFAVQTGEVAAARAVLGNAMAAAGFHINEIDSIVRRGHAVKEIVGQIRDGDHHVLVAGRRGMGPFRELLMGSICDKLLQLSPVSMLVVK